VNDLHTDDFPSLQAINELCAALGLLEAVMGIPRFAPLKTVEHFGVRLPPTVAAAPVSNEAASLAVAAALSQTPRMQHQLRATLRNVVANEQRLLDIVVQAFDAASTDDSMQFCLFTADDVRDAIKRKREPLPAHWILSASSSSSLWSSSSSSSSSSRSSSSFSLLSGPDEDNQQQLSASEESLSLITSRFGFVASGLSEARDVLDVLLSSLRTGLGFDAPADAKALREILTSELLQPQTESFYFNFFEDLSKTAYRDLVKRAVKEQGVVDSALAALLLLATCNRFRCLILLLRSVYPQVAMLPLHRLDPCA